MGIFDSLFGKKKLSLDEADKKNDAFLEKNPVAKNEEDEMMRQAAKCMSSGLFTESLNRYVEMSDKFPHKKGLYLSQAGAACFFLQEYNTAIDYYTSALENGADSSMMDDNIWEAIEILFNNTKDKSHLERYLNIFPKGNYVKTAEKLLL